MATTVGQVEGSNLGVLQVEIGLAQAGVGEQQAAARAVADGHLAAAGRGASDAVYVDAGQFFGTGGGGTDWP